MIHQSRQLRGTHLLLRVLFPVERLGHAARGPSLLLVLVVVEGLVHIAVAALVLLLVAHPPRVHLHVVLILQAGVRLLATSPAPPASSASPTPTPSSSPSPPASPLPATPAPAPATALLSSCVRHSLVGGRGVDYLPPAISRLAKETFQSGAQQDREGVWGPSGPNTVILTFIGA
jgi:hypothetical protein